MPCIRPLHAAVRLRVLVSCTAPAARLEAAKTPHQVAPLASIQEQREQIEKQMLPQGARARALYAVSVEPQTIGGVSVNAVQPAAGVLESAPLAALGGLRVVSVHYRQGPEADFPAASEDVATVYGELLKHYRPAAIGIYGCSSVPISPPCHWHDFRRTTCRALARSRCCVAARGGYSRGTLFIHRREELDVDTLVHYPEVAADPRHRQRFARVLIAAQKDAVNLYVTSDDGVSWTKAGVTQREGVIAVTRPAVAFSPDGVLVAAWRDIRADGSYDIFAATSADGRPFGATA